MTGWIHGYMAAFDLETTGIDVEHDRIVTATLIHLPAPVGGERSPKVCEWLADPGIPIPQAAAAVHGITAAHAAQHGRPARDVVGELAEQVADVLSGCSPIVGMNLQYDLTILDRECRRHGIPTLAERLDEHIRPIIDVYVIDKQVDAYRPGSRNLAALCAHYRVILQAAHNASADALAAARVAWRIAQTYPDIAAMGVDDLHDAQIGWKADQSASFADYLRRKGDESGAARVRGEWPYIPYRSLQ